MFLSFHRELPRDSDIQCYFSTNANGENSYVYCKVIYDAITEALLCEDYEIRNVDLQEKGCSQKVSVNSESVPYCDLQELSKNSQTEKDKEVRKINKELVSSRSTSRPIPIKSKTFSHDDMYLLEKRRRRNYSHQIHNSSTQVYYIPIAVCIETKIPYVEQAKNLLNALTGVIFKDDKNYMKDIQNLIFSYAEFCSHLLTLTHITVPPPLTHLNIPIANTEISLQEGWISEFPCDSDISIAYLFSFLPIDFVVMVWPLFLLENSIIFHVSESNTFFYVAKAFMDLMFPLTWAFPKGLITNPEFLSVPTSYCFCVLERNFRTVEELAARLEDMDEEYLEYIIIDINVKRSAIYSKLAELTPYHNEKKLRDKLVNCFAEFGLSEDSKVSVKDIDCKEFGHKVQMIFMNEVTELLNCFKVTRQERPAILGSNCTFAKLEIKGNTSKLSKLEMKFLNKFKETQAVASFYDEQLVGIQGNYARKQAINSNNKGFPPIEPLNITVCSTTSLVLSRLDKLVELQAFKQNKEQNNANKQFFNWKKGVSRILEKGTNSRSRSSEATTQSILSNSPEAKTKYEEDVDQEIIITMQVINEESKDPPKKSNDIKNRFYGRKGILSFLEEFIKRDDEPAHKAMIIEEVRNIEDYFKHSVVQTRAYTGNSNNSTSSLREDSVSCIFGTHHPESSFADNSPAPVAPVLVSSLVDVKDFTKMSSFISRERLLFNFTSSSCFQFELFLGYFYYKQDPESPFILKRFIEAFKHIHKGGKYQIYFPAMMLKSLIRRLTLEELKGINTDSTKLKEIVDEIKVNKEKSAVLESRHRPREEQKRIPVRNVVCLNNGEGKVTNEDPSVVLIEALNTLIEILNNCKSEKEKAFRLIHNFQNLKQVINQTEFFAVIFLSHH
jgi:hypothetical protein